MTTDISAIENIHKELRDSFSEAFQGRSNYQIDKFVVGQHLTQERQYAQCVVELQVKYYGLRRMDIRRRRLVNEIKSAANHLDREEKEIELELLEIDVIGQLREFEHLYAIFKAMPKFTNEQLQAAESRYWLKRLSTQSQIDIEATGRISTGNYEALRQAEIVTGHSARFFENMENHPGYLEGKA